MKSLVAVLTLFSLLNAAPGKEPAKSKKSRGSVPGPYPSIIQIPPAEKPAQGETTGIIQSELGGREMHFLQTVSRTGREQLALVELARSKGSSDQLVLVAETIASTQPTEAREIARLAEAQGMTLATAAAPAGGLAELSGPKFEKAWIDRLIAVNEASVAAYESGTKAQDPAIRSFAEKMLPAAKARLQVANRLGGRSVAAPAENAVAPRPISPPITAPPEKSTPNAPARR